MSLVFAVHNQGIEIKEEGRRQLFNLFGQADTSDVRSFQGLGLGLNACQLWARSMGGRIDLQSSSEQATVFTCAVDVKLKSVPTAVATPGTVLVLTDSEDFASYVGQHCRSIQLEWQHVQTLPELKRLLIDPESIVVVDCHKQSLAQV